MKKEPKQKETQFCEECLEIRPFTRVELKEIFEHEGKRYSTIHKYDKCTICNTLHEPHKDIDININNDLKLINCNEQVDDFLRKYHKTGVSLDYEISDIDEPFYTVSIYSSEISLEGRFNLAEKLNRLAIEKDFGFIVIPG